MMHNHPDFVWDQPQLKFAPEKTIQIFMANLDHLPKNRPLNICISLTTDPFQPIMESKYRLTYRILEAIAASKVKNQHVWMILTKQPPPEEYFAVMQKIPSLWFGMTITSIKKYELEQNAADPQERIRTIRMAKLKYGLKTFVSIEPLFPPNQPMDILYALSNCLDWVILGKYNPSTKFNHFYRQVYVLTIKYLQDYKIPFLIKDKLKEVLPEFHSTLERPTLKASLKNQGLDRFIQQEA